MIHAPTGFGKSTLAAQWGEVLTEEGVAVAWLTVDHDDNNVVWFLAHLIEAIRRVRPALARRARRGARGARRRGRAVCAHVADQRDPRAR